MWVKGFAPNRAGHPSKKTALKSYLNYHEWPVGAPHASRSRIDSERLCCLTSCPNRDLSGLHPSTGGAQAGGSVLAGCSWKMALRGRDLCFRVHRIVTWLCGCRRLVCTAPPQKSALKKMDTCAPMHVLCFCGAKAPLCGEGAQPGQKNAHACVSCSSVQQFAGRIM